MSLCDDHGLPAELWNVEHRQVGCGRCLLEQSSSLKEWVLVEDVVEAEAQETHALLERQLTSSFSVLNLAAHASSLVHDECDEAALQRYLKIAESVTLLAEHMALAAQSLGKLLPLMKPSLQPLPSAERARDGVAPTLAPCSVGFEDATVVGERTAANHGSLAAKGTSQSLLPLPRTAAEFSPSELLLPTGDGVGFSSTSWDAARVAYRVVLQGESPPSPPAYMNSVGHTEYYAAPSYGPPATAAIAAQPLGYAAFHGSAFVGGGGGVGAVAYGANPIPLMAHDAELPSALIGPPAVEQCEGGIHRHFFLIWLNPDQCRTSVQDGIIWPSKQARRLLYVAQETAPVILLVAELDTNNPMSYASTLFGYAFLGDRAVRTEVLWRVSGLVLHERDIAPIAPLSLRRTAELASVDSAAGERLCAFIDEEMTKRTLSSAFYPKPGRR